MADDMGYGDVRALNPRSKIPTPHLDRLAGQGMTFLDAHTPSAVCTPTRYGLLTGRYSWRTRLKKGVLNGYGEPLLAKDRETIGTFLGAPGVRDRGRGQMASRPRFRQDRRGRVRFQQAGQRRAAHPRLRLLLHHSGVASISRRTSISANGEDHRVSPRGAEAIKFPRFMRRGERAPDLDPVKVLDRPGARGVELHRAAGAHETKPFPVVYAVDGSAQADLAAQAFFRGKTKLGPYGDFIVQVDARCRRRAASDRQGRRCRPHFGDLHPPTTARTCIGATAWMKKTTSTTKRSRRTARSTTPRTTSFGEPRPISGRPATACRSSPACPARSSPAASNPNRSA